MRNVVPGLISSSADYAVVYAALRHLLLCVPAVDSGVWSAASDVDRNMKTVVVGWISDADDAREFGEPRRDISFDNGTPNDGGCVPIALCLACDIGVDACIMLHSHRMQTPLLNLSAHKLTHTDPY